MVKRETTIENAKIDSTMLGIEDHGFMTAFIFVSGPGWGCGFGGFAFDQWVADKKARIGHSYGMEFIRRVLDVVGVEKWEELKGKYCRVESEGCGGGIVRIGNLLEDKWFDPRALAKEME